MNSTAECHVCKAQVPNEAAVGDFCHQPQCPQYLSDNLPIPNYEGDLYPNRISKTQCPICESNFLLADVDGGVIAWCGGACPSVAGDHGAFSRTDDGAAYVLQRLIEQEIEQHDHLQEWEPK